MPDCHPAERAHEDVPAEFQERFFIPDDLIEVPRLPGEVGLPGVPDPAAAGALEVSNGLSQRARALAGARSIDIEDAVEVVRHHDPMVELQEGTAMSHLHPLFGDDITEIGDDHRSLLDLSEPADPLPGADRHTVGAATAVVPSR